MVTPDNLMSWLRMQLWPVLIVALLMIGVYLALKISASRRHAALAAERAGVSEDSFIEHLSQYNFDPSVTGTTYRYLQDVQLVQFPILPTDNLDEDLGLGHEDVEQSVRELLLALDRREVPGLRHRPIITVEDLVRHLQASPRRQAISVAA
jgi:hypothetical protein